MYFSSATQKNLKVTFFNPLNAQLNPICHLLALLGAHHIFHVSGLRVNLKTELYLKARIYKWGKIPNFETLWCVWTHLAHPLSTYLNPVHNNMKTNPLIRQIHLDLLCKYWFYYQTIIPYTHRCSRRSLPLGFQKKKLYGFTIPPWSPRNTSTSSSLISFPKHVYR